MAKKKRPIINQTLEADLKDLKLIYDGIAAADELEISSPAFNHSLNRAKSRIESEMKAHNKSMEPSKKYKEYTEKRRKLCEEYAEKETFNKNKKDFVIKAPVEGALSPDYVINPEKADEFNEKIVALEKKYAKEIEARKAYLDKEEELLSIKREIDIYKVIPENVPEKISLGVMAAVYKLIAYKAPAAKSLKTIKIQKGKILSISKIMNDLSGVTEPKDFVSKMAFNLWVIKDMADKLYEEKAYEDHRQVEKEREELSAKHAEKYNYSGEPILFQNKEDKKNYYSLKDQEAFNQDFEKFKEKNQSIMDAYSKWLEEETTIKGYTFDIEDVPELPRVQLESITEFIEV